MSNENCGCGGRGCARCFKRFRIQTNLPLPGSTETTPIVEVRGAPCERIYLISAINNTAGAGNQGITFDNMWTIRVPEGAAFTISGCDLPYPHHPTQLSFTSGFSSWVVIVGEV